jgi:energy-coupling factor transporter ATP-binding protein EcfA2
MKARVDNPFVFGEVIDQHHFVDRENDLAELIRDLADGQKVFLLSPRRFGKSTLVSLALLKLKKQHVRTVTINVSDYADYSQFLQKFSEKVLKSAGPWDRVKDWAVRFARSVKPEVNVDMQTGDFTLLLGGKRKADSDAIAEDVFALPEELTRAGGFRMAICLDEFQQIDQFGGVAVENVLRNQVQRQRQVGYVFAGSQPSLMDEMLRRGRPFHKAGPRRFLEKIPADAWTEFITNQFRSRGRTITNEAIERLLQVADLIPYDVQRVAHEIWDIAESAETRTIEKAEVDEAVTQIVMRDSTYHEISWEQLTVLQRSLLQVLAQRGSRELFSQAVRDQFRLGPASSVQKALLLLRNKDILDRYGENYFFIDPMFAVWIRRKNQ